MDYMVEPLPDGGVRENGSQTSHALRVRTQYVDSKSEIEAEQDFEIKKNIYEKLFMKIMITISTAYQNFKI